MNKTVHIEGCRAVDLVNEETNYNDEKQIKIMGTNNRYKIKKVMKTEESIKKRVIATKWNLSEEYLQKEKQLQILQDSSLTKEKQFIIQELERKIQGYKQQDVDKDILNKKKLITLEQVKQMVVDCSLSCHYCQQDIFILYEIVREIKQWTLDRIDNNIGHNYDNVVISCLSCNLQRRCQNKEKFSFTKQMKIHRDNY
jgi:hypothetical protein